MASQTPDRKAVSIERRQLLAVARLEAREKVRSQIPEYGRVASALVELANSVELPQMRREIMGLQTSVQSAFERLEQRAEDLAGPGIAELLLPLGVQHRLQEANLLSVRQVRAALAEGGSKLMRLPTVGATTCDLVRAHVEARDANEPPPTKAEPSKTVSLTKREKVLAEKMGLTVAEAGAMLKGTR